MESSSGVVVAAGSRCVVVWRHVRHGAHRPCAVLRGARQGRQRLLGAEERERDDDEPQLGEGHVRHVDVAASLAPRVAAGRRSTLRRRPRRLVRVSSLCKCFLTISRASRRRRCRRRRRRRSVNPLATAGQHRQRGEQSIARTIRLPVP